MEISTSMLIYTQGDNMKEAEDYYVAVNFSGTLKPMLKSEGFAGYGCPDFKTKEDCEKWIKRYNKKYPGLWLRGKSYADCECAEQSLIFEKGVKALAKKLVELDDSPKLRRTLIMLGALE